MLSWSNSLGTNLTHFLRFHLWMLGVSSSSACSGGSWESVYCVLLSQTPEIEGDSPPEGCCTSSVRIGIWGVFHVGSMPGGFAGAYAGCSPLHAEGSSYCCPQPGEVGGFISEYFLSRLEFIMLSPCSWFWFSVFPTLTQCRGPKYTGRWVELDLQA